MFVGGSAGSTGGGMKVSRYLVLLKHSGMQLKKFFHPRAVFSLKVGGRGYPEDIIISIFQFFFLYIFMVVTGTVIMTGFGLDLKSAQTAVQWVLWRTMHFYLTLPSIYCVFLCWWADWRFSQYWCWFCPAFGTNRNLPGGRNFPRFFHCSLRQLLVYF